MIAAEKKLLTLEQLTMMPIIQFEKLDVIHDLIKYGKTSSIDLSVLLISNSSIASGCEKVVTFDKKALKYQLFELLK